MKCGLIIPTLNAGGRFRALLEQIGRQTLAASKLIVDSESTDGTVELAEKFGFEVLPVSRKTFNHGSTRQAALAKLLPLDVIIFLTQDVLLRDDSALAKLVEVFAKDSAVGLAYGRQLPHENATLEAKILREFNYPPQSQIKNFDSRKTFGIKAAFASNSFAAYRVNALDAIGGFPRVILGEDMYVAAKMLMAGFSVAYVAEAQVYHSHNYTVAQEFKRYFDIGAFHARERWILENFGSAEGAGKKFVLMKLAALWRESPRECFGAVFHDAAKLFGYRLGRLEKFLPLFLKRKVSMHKNFWEGS